MEIPVELNPRDARIVWEKLRSYRVGVCAAMEHLERSEWVKSYRQLEMIHYQMTMAIEEFQTKHPMRG